MLRDYGQWNAIRGRFIVGQEEKVLLLYYTMIYILKTLFVLEQGKSMLL